MPNGRPSIRELAREADVSESTMKRTIRISRAGLGPKLISGELGTTEALRQANEILGLPNQPSSYQILKARVADLEERLETVTAMAQAYKELYYEAIG